MRFGFRLGLATLVTAAFIGPGTVVTASMATPYCRHCFFLYWLRWFYKKWPRECRRSGFIIGAGFWAGGKTLSALLSSLPHYQLTPTLTPYLNHLQDTSIV